jgi:hypothetical protein
VKVTVLQLDLQVLYSENPNTGLVPISTGCFWLVPDIQILDHSKTRQICPVLLGLTVIYKKKIFIYK